MQYFYVEACDIQGDHVNISGEDYNHIKNVLRMKPGERLNVVDGESMEYKCIVDGYLDRAVSCRIESRERSAREPEAEIILFQGLPKKDKMEFIVQKAVELGATKIVPVLTKRTVAVPSSREKESKRIERLNAISLAAAKQCGRGIVPEVTEVCDFAEAVKKAAELDAAVIPYELAEDFGATKSVMKSLKGKKSIGIFIGPEGGFERSEVELATENKVLPVTLGKRILRTETAAVYTLSVIMYEITD